MGRPSVEKIYKTDQALRSIWKMANPLEEKCLKLFEKLLKAIDQSYIYEQLHYGRCDYFSRWPTGNLPVRF